ncbi:MAG: FAD:protein FMN transferase, partial [Rhodothermales bacterium]
GAFDPTVGPLMRAWGFFRDSGGMPDPAALAEARSRTGMHLVTLDAETRTVTFEQPGVGLDFGGIGKGYAVDEAVSILKEMGVERGLLHGGTSTVVGFGPDPWMIGIPYPGEIEEMLAIVSLDSSALSVSAVWGKAFEFEGRTYGHVLDPRVGRPVEGAVLAAVVLPSATEADALSTALLVLGDEGAHWASGYNGLRMLQIFPAEGRFEAVEAGIPILPTERCSVAPRARSLTL